MSVSEEEGGQDYDDILGYPGDGSKDKDDTDPDETYKCPVVSTVKGMKEIGSG